MTTPSSRLLVHRRVRGCDAALAEGLAHLRRAAPAAAGSNRRGDGLSLLQQRPGAARTARQNAARNEPVAHRHRQRRLDEGWRRRGKRCSLSSRRRSRIATHARSARITPRSFSCGSPTRAEVPEIIERSRPDTTVAVRPFMANRYDFVEKFRAESSRRNRPAVARRTGRRAKPPARSSIRCPTTRVVSKSSFLCRRHPAFLRASHCASCRLRRARRLRPMCVTRMRRSWPGRSMRCSTGSIAAAIARSSHPSCRSETDTAGLHTQIVWAFEQAPPAR